MDYKKSGVDLERVARVKAEIKRLAQSTYGNQVLAGVGPFGAMYELGPGTVLVQSIDGVGTKLKLAQMMNSVSACGIDLVNHCINDILCQGAKPLIFLDYIAQDRLRPQEVLSLIEGITIACKEAGISLIGGETAQMPGTYQGESSDVVGSITGVVKKHKIIDGGSIRVGNKILGLPSSGLHTNGYSLVNKLFWEKKQYSPYFYFKELRGQLGRILLEPHQSYLKPIQSLIHHQTEQGFFLLINGIAHITGGGLKENIARILPESCRAKIRLGSWPILPIFQFVQEQGGITSKEMYRVFNMGIGMVLIVSAIDVEEIFEFLRQIGQPVYEIGEVVAA